MEKEKRKLKELLAETNAPRLKVGLLKKNTEVFLECGGYFVRAKVNKKVFLSVFIVLLKQLPNVLIHLLTPWADTKFNFYRRLWHSNPDITENCFDKLCLKVAHMRDITIDIRAKNDEKDSDGCKIIRLNCTKENLLKFLQLANNLCVEYNRFVTLFTAAIQTIEKLEEEGDFNCIGFEGLISKYGNMLIKILNEILHTVRFKVVDDSDLLSFASMEVD